MDFLTGTNDHILNDVMPCFIHSSAELHPQSRKEETSTIFPCLSSGICLKIIKIMYNERLQLLFCILTDLYLPFSFLHLCELSAFDLGIMQCDKIATSHAKLS